MTDVIPFHLQLSGSLCSLKSFIVPPTRFEQAVIRVILLRETAIETGEKNVTVISEGKLREIPPSLCELHDSIHLDWEGEVGCSSDTYVGSFSAGSVTVKVSSILLKIL